MEKRNHRCCDCSKKPVHYPNCWFKGKRSQQKEIILQLALTCMGMFSSFRPVKLRMTPASLTFTTGFVLVTDVFSFFLWRKPQPRNTETSTTYNTATETSMHFACIPQNLSMIIIRSKKSIAFRNNLLSPQHSETIMWKWL